MTLMDITLHYLAPVGPRQLRAMDSVREVYGIRRLSLDEIRHSILVGMTRLACTPKMCGRCFEVQAWIRTMSLKQFLMLVEVCAHIEGINEIKLPDVRVCELCVQTGSPWVHLRTCQECGVTLCCDSSPNRHATKHAHASGHPVIASAEPGERWLYCYPNDAFAQY